MEEEDYMDEIDEEDLNAFLEATKLIANNVQPVLEKKEETISDGDTENEPETKVEETKSGEEDDELEYDEIVDSSQREEVKDKNEILALEERVEVSRKEDEGKNINVKTLLSQYDQLDTVILETDDKKGDKEEDKKVSSSDLDITSILAKYGQLNMIKIQKVEPQETENKTIQDQADYNEESSQQYKDDEKEETTEKIDNAEYTKGSEEIEWNVENFDEDDEDIEPNKEAITEDFMNIEEEPQEKEIKAREEELGDVEKENIKEEESVINIERDTDWKTKEEVMEDFISLGAEFDEDIEPNKETIMEDFMGTKEEPKETEVKMDPNEDKFNEDLVQEEPELEEPALKSKSADTLGLPPGWILSPSGGVVAPSILQFTFSSRLAAYQAILSSSATITTREHMFDSLVYEGWIANSLLPPGWILQHTSTTTNFFSKDGVFMDSFQKTLAFLRSSSQYSELEVQTFASMESYSQTSQLSEQSYSQTSQLAEESYSQTSHLAEDNYSQTIQAVDSWLTSIDLDLDEEPRGENDGSLDHSLGAKRKREANKRKGDENKRQRLADPSWLDGDQTIPAGWKMKTEVAIGGNKYLSPDGNTFKSPRHILVHMIQKGYPMAQVQEVRGKMVEHHGWQEDSLLPEGWMFKPGQPGVKSKGLIYCKQDGQSISSHTEALNSILPIDEEHMKEFIKKNSQKAADFAEHKTSEYLPEGWLCKDTPENSIQINVVSTDGLRFYSYKKAAEHMKALEYSEEDINKFFLYPDGKDLKQYWKDRILKGENGGGP